MKKRLLILTTLLVAMAAGASAAIKADTYYLTGSIASWGINEDYELVEVEAGLYKCAGVAITTSDLIKVVKSNRAGSGIGSWYPDGMDNNQKVTEDGTYTVYFRPAGDGTEADGYTYIPHGSDADAHGCTNGGYMFKFVETPVAAGTYYLYNPYSGKFLSRGSAGGTRAVADDYGFPINVTFDSEGAYTLDNYDGTGAYGDDYWMYADCKGTRVRTFTLEAVGDGYYLHNTSRNTEDNRMFVYMKEDGTLREAQGTLCNGISQKFDEYEYKNNFSTDSRWPTETFTYWDLEKEGFRTFKASNLIKIKAATIVNCMHRS